MRNKVVTYRQLSHYPLVFGINAQGLSGVISVGLAIPKLFASMETMASPEIYRVTRAGRREWVGLAVLALPTLLVSMDATVTYLALPVISASLQPSSAQLLWITDIYTFLEGGLLITMGTLGDRIGRKKLLLWGAVAFALASVIAAFAPGAGMLIAARALLGVAGATLLPSTVALIRSMFHDDKQRAVAIGIWTTCYSTGTMLGPLLGGVLLDHFWWGSVFLIGVPVMVLFLALGPRLLPEHKAETSEKPDLLSVFLLLTGILLIIYVIKRIGEQGDYGSLSLLLAATGILIMVIFLQRQRKVKGPLIDLQLFHVPAFNATLGTLLIALFCWSGLYLFVAQYLQLVLGLDPSKAGLLTVPAAAMGMLGCMGAPLLARPLGQNRVILLGMLILSIGAMLLWRVTDNTGLGLLIPATLLLTLGCSLVVTLGVDKVISSAPRERAGAAAGIYETSTTFGTALGIAILGSIGTAIYRNQMKGNNMAGISVDMIERARNTLGEAQAISHQLPGQSGVVLFREARMAFVQSFSVTAAIAGGLLVMIMVLAAWIYKRDKKTLSAAPACIS